MNLYPRYIEPVLKTALTDTPVVCLLGPRQAGKTTLVQKLKPKRTYISFDDHDLLTAAKDDPAGFVQGLPSPVILDEVQRAPEILLPIKVAVDRERKPGRFLLTGSANLLLLPSVQESLAGRMEIVQLYPLTEMEKRGSRKSLLESLLTGAIKTSITSGQNVAAGIPEAICQGGYPEPLLRTPARARQWHKQYLNAIIQRDVKDVAAIRDQNELLRLMEMLGYRTASLLNISNLAVDLGIDRTTVEKYLAVLERLYLIRRLPAWHRNQAKRLVKTPKVHMIDSGLAATLNGLSIEDWRTEETVFGKLLESFVVQQIICQAGWAYPELQFSHYRDKDQIEVDLIIEKGRDVWAVEIKRAASIQEKDGAGLARISAQTGKYFRGGILLYSGVNCLPLKINKCFAVPLTWLWT